MTQNLAWAASLLLLYQALSKANEPAQRQADMNGILGFWAPLAVGGFVLFKLLK